MLRTEPLRNPAIVSAIADALQRHRYDHLFMVLCRFSGLPGPHLNEQLAWAVGQAVASEGAKGDALVAQLCSVDAQQAPARSAAEFLPVVGAFSLAARYLSGQRAEGALDKLRLLAEDPRHLVRESVVHALGEIGRVRGADLAELLAPWMDGYLSAAVTIEALSARSWLDAATSSDHVLSRLDEAFLLVESAQRSEQRSQGYRTLVKALAQGPAKVMDRFPEATLSWLEPKAATVDVELRESLTEILRRARARGHSVSALSGFEGQLEASAPKRRDPKTYVGPTRQRGARKR